MQKRFDISIIFTLLVGFSLLLISCGGGGDGKKSPPKVEARDLFVLDPITSSIMVFDASSSGDVTLLRRFGNLTGLGNPSGVAVDTVNNEIIVANGGNATITTYARTADGNIVPLRTIIGAGATSIAVDTVNDEIIVGTGNAIKVFARTAQGEVEPLRIIPGDSTELGNGPIQVAVDTVNNEIIAANANNTDKQILFFSRTADGAVPPLRTISGLIGADSIALDTINNELIVGTYNSIKVYPRTANGNVPPLRTISGDLTDIDWAFSVAVDTVNNEIFVANNNRPLSITVYPRTANGNVLPLRTISGDLTDIDGSALSVAVDTINNEIFSANGANCTVTVYPRTANGNITPSRILGKYPYLHNPSDIVADVLNGEILLASSESIVIYPKGASGDVAPLRNIEQGANRIDIDAIHNEIFAAAGGTINVFERTANGNVAPLRTFDHSKYFPNMTVEIVGIAVDAKNDEIFVGSLISNPIATTPPSSVISVYPRTANGEVTPLRTINPWGFITDLALDSTHNEIDAINVGGPCIFVYERTAVGNDTPLRTIYGSSQLLSMSSIAVDAGNNEIFVSGSDSLAQPAISIFSRTGDGNVAPLRTLNLKKYVGRGWFERITLSPQ